jgi:hypothetical protein
MGLLDDAIRDHLELKRLRGADPGEVAREQREALDPVPGADAAAGQDWAPAPDDLDPGANGETLPAAATPAAAPAYSEDAEAAPAAGSRDSAGVGQETVELDMQTLMDEDEGQIAGGVSGEQADIEGSGRGDHPSADDVGGDQLEWEVPGESPGMARADDGHHTHAVGDDGPGGTAGRMAT